MLFEFLAILWSIWKARNGLVFCGDQFVPSVVISNAKENALWFAKGMYMDVMHMKGAALPSPALCPGKFPSFIIKAYPTDRSTLSNCLMLYVDGAGKEGNS